MVVDNKADIAVVYGSSSASVIRTHRGQGSYQEVRALGDLDGDGAGDFSMFSVISGTWNGIVNAPMEPISRPIESRFGHGVHFRLRGVGVSD